LEREKPALPLKGNTICGPNPSAAFACSKYESVAYAGAPLPTSPKLTLNLIKFIEVSR
jgi:hypothetical protein